MKKKKGFGLLAKQEAAGWGFLAPASLLIFVMSFYPMVQAFITSLKTGSSANMQWAEPVFKNYIRMFKDKVFMTSMGNTFLYLLIQVPIMLVLAILLAQLLNNKDLKLRGLFRTLIFLPCATALVSYALIFKTLFATEGLINAFLKGRYNATDVIEDVPFFYPIIGVIRHNLLKNMRNDVISKFNQ